MCMALWVKSVPCDLRGRCTLFGGARGATPHRFLHAGLIRVSWWCDGAGALATGLGGKIMDAGAPQWLARPDRGALGSLQAQFPDVDADVRAGSGLPCSSLRAVPADKSLRVLAGVPA